MGSVVQPDIWALAAADPGSWVVIPTNAETNSKGEAIMGGGPQSLAHQAKQKLPHLPAELGKRIRVWKGLEAVAYVELFPARTGHAEPNVITFRTKTQWRDPARLDLIMGSALELVYALPNIDGTVYMPKVGCGVHTGQLDWAVVKPLLTELLKDHLQRVVFVE
jgi:hypothetical protein